jgi:transposase
MPKKSPFRIVLTQAERKELETIIRKYTSPYCDVIRAKAILLAAKDFENKQIAERLDMPRQIVSKWRKRFFEERLAGLDERPRRGRPPVFSP